MRYSWLRPAGWIRLVLPALIVGLGITGYAVTSGAIRRDRDAAAVRRAEVESVRAQALLGRARAYVVGLGNALAGEPRPSQRRFAQLEGSTVGSVGLVDALWVERVPAARRAAYERRLGAPVTRLTRSGRFEPAPPARSYLVATFTSGTRPELRRGVDISQWPALATAIGDPASVFAVTASRLGSLGREPGFYLLGTAKFGRRGYLAVFVPRGWLTVGLEDDPRRLAISVDGRRLEGRLESAPAAVATFDALARRWRVEVGPEPPSALLSSLPWLALAWPAAAALVALFVARGIMRRRQAEREVERIFELSVDMLCVAGLDGYFKRVNPSFERTLGYSSDELTSQPFIDFVHPDDRERTREALAALARGQEIVQFENRYLCRDGSARWLQWSVRPVPDRGLTYAAARDVTDQRRLTDELTASRARVVAAADETRRRIERDLHDGTQQRLVSLALALRATEAKVPAGLDELRAELADAAQGLSGAVEDLQEFARGIHPAILSKGGLGPALKTLARRSSVPVELDVNVGERLPTAVEAAAYYVVSEALTNAAKHAQASVVFVDLATTDSIVEVTIRDDGVGGADPTAGSGLTGLRDRVEALGGTIEIASSGGRGTSVHARIPARG